MEMNAANEGQMKFDILNRFTGAVQISAEIDCRESESYYYSRA